MLLNTKHFGEITVSEKEIIHFEEGIPGFLEEKQFVLVFDNEQAASFCWLQSAGNTNIAFVLVDVISLLPSYEPEVSAEEISDLGAYDEIKELKILNVAVVPEDFKKMTVNLAAPIIINTKTNKGRQVLVNNEEYGVRHYLYEEMEKNGLLKKDGE